MTSHSQGTRLTVPKQDARRLVIRISGQLDVLLYIVHYSPCRIIHTTLSNVIAIHMEHAPWSKTITDQSLLPMPLQRHNMYDGSEEFWVIIKEEGRRQDSLAHEETHEKKAKAGTKLYYHMLFSETFWHQLFDSFVQPGRRWPSVRLWNVVSGPRCCPEAGCFGETTHCGQRAWSGIEVWAGPDWVLVLILVNWYLQICSFTFTLIILCLLFTNARPKRSSRSSWNQCCRKRAVWDRWWRNWRPNSRRMMEPKSILIHMYI